MLDPEKKYQLLIDSLKMNPSFSLPDSLVNKIESTIAKSKQLNFYDLLPRSFAESGSLKRFQELRLEAEQSRSLNTAYSEEMKTAANYYENYEYKVDSLADFIKGVEALSTTYPDLRFVWRGQANHEWGLHSKLFRSLMRKNGVHGPEKRHRKKEPYPSEEEMVLAESIILDEARNNWRFGDLSALQLFALLQHFDAPTRLLDVTFNPLVAGWFAVEDESMIDTPARVFALAVAPKSGDPNQQHENNMNSMIKGAEAINYDPFWHAYKNNSDRINQNWGTGGIRRVWKSPTFESRLLAQNVGFIIDGVPISRPGIAPYYSKYGKSSDYWKRADLLAAGSIYAKLYKINQIKANKKFPFPATVTFLLTPKAKKNIRQSLKNAFGFDTALIFPDIQGLSRYIVQNLNDLLTEKPL